MKPDAPVTSRRQFMQDRATTSVAATAFTLSGLTVLAFEQAVSVATGQVFEISGR